MFLNSQARKLSAQSFAIFRMAHGVNNWVQAGGNFGHKSWDLGDQRGDGALAADDSGEHYQGVGGPDAGPQGHVGDRDLGNPNLGGLGAVSSVGSEGVDVHSLGLFTKCVLVSPHGFDDRAVEEEDHGHGDQVAEEEAEKNVALVVHVLIQVVVAAGVEHALGGEPSPQVQ